MHKVLAALLFVVAAALCAPQFVSYHSVTSSHHQTQFNTLAPQGYRIVSISVHGPYDDPRYSVIWIKQTGTAWAAVHGVNANTYQNTFNTYTSQGYQNTLISVTGTGSNLVFAGVFVQQSGNHEAYFGLTQSAFDAQVIQKKAQNYYPSSVSVYGSAPNYYYAVTWLTNTAGFNWKVRGLDGDAWIYQTTFNQETSAGFRLSALSVTSDLKYVSVWRSDSIGGWGARHHLTYSQYQPVLDTETAAGAYPIWIAGAGTSDINYRFAVIFIGYGGAPPATTTTTTTTTAAPTTSLTVPPNTGGRTWTATGTVNAALTGFDNLMKTFMQNNNLRVGQLSISKNGVIKYSRAYTWAEPGYKITQTSTLMRYASVSKMFTAAAIQKLFDTGRLNPSSKVYTILGKTNPQDPRSNDITIQHLLDNKGGYDRAMSGDPIFNMRGIAQSLGLSTHVTKDDIIQYMWMRPLDFTPGTRESYSNYGWMVLGRVIEIVSGVSYETYVRNNVNAPIGISNVRVSATLASINGEAEYDDTNNGLSAWYVTLNNLVPYVRGGEGWMTEVMDAGGGLMGTTDDMVKFAWRNLVYGNGARWPAGQWSLGRTGSMAGVSSCAFSRGFDGVDWGFNFNSRNLCCTSVDTLISQINALLDQTQL